MTTANARGGWLKTLEINRDGSASSDTVLKDTFLKKAEGYVCQVSRFIVNNTPRLNLIDEVMIEVLRRGQAPGDTVGTVLPTGGQPEFQPSAYRTYLELARKMEQYCVALNDHFGQPSIEFQLRSNGTFQLKLYRGFTSVYYLKIGKETQKFTGLPEYIFVTTDGNVTYTQRDGVQRLFNVNDADHLAARIAAGQAISFNAQMFNHAVAEDRQFTSGRPMSAFDHRLSLDVVAYWPISNIISFLDGKESHEFVFARFPVSDYLEIHNKTVVVGGDLRRSHIIQETVNLGIEDLCRNNPNTVSNYLLPGELRHCNFRLETRYIADGVITRVPTDMDEGFWSLKLLFSKKMT